VVQKKRLNKVHLSYIPHPLRIYRPTRLARLIDCDLSTIWRWRKTGVLPPPIQIGGVLGWTEDQLKQLFQERRESDHD
jgi:predicted DNA-binding transcriptional regulator AlpA